MLKKNLFLIMVLFSLVFSQIAVQCLATDEQTVWSYVNEAKSHIKAGNDTAARATVDELAVAHPADTDTPKGVCRVADKYNEMKKYEKSKEFYQKVVDRWPAAEDAMWAQSGIAHSNVALGDDTAAQAAIDKLVADYHGHKHVPIAVGQIADRYREIKKYDKANRLYQKIIDTWPGSEQAMWSQMHLAKSNIRDGNDVGAQANVDKLLVDFPHSEHFVSAVYAVAEDYRQHQRYDKAITLYRSVVDISPQTNYGMWSQMGLAISNINLGNDSEAKTSIDRLLTDFTKNDDLAYTICTIVQSYCDLQQYDKARQLYQSAADGWAGDEQAVWGQMIVAIANIQLGDDTAAQTAINKLCTDFAGRENLTRAVFMIAEQYHNKAIALENKGLDSQAAVLFRKAIAMWEKMINEFTPSFLTPEACYFTGLCYCKLGEYGNSIVYYKKLADGYPEQRNRWYALFMIGHNYETLAKSGAMPQSEAGPKISDAYTQLVEKYPACPVVQKAQSWLASHNY
jgi:tetratricopeptide (TPR) repeat protein